jgi:hypothetical protein
MTVGQEPTRTSNEVAPVWTYGMFIWCGICRSPVAEHNTLAHGVARPLTAT